MFIYYSLSNGWMNYIDDDEDDEDWDEDDEDCDEDDD